MAPRISIWPKGGPTRGGTAVLVRLDGDESWTSSSVITVVFGTRIRRIPVSAKLGQGGRDFVTCTCTAPKWGEQESVHVILIVNKVEAASTSFFFFLPPRTLLAKPDMARCSQKTNITLSGENFPGAPGRGGTGGVLPTAGETIDVRLVSESGELLTTQKGTVGLGTITVELAGIALTGAVHFEVSLNGADFDKSYSEWQEQARLLGSTAVQREKAAPEIEQLVARMHKASVTLWENPLLTAVAPSFLYVGAAADATLSCSGYPVVDTGSVVVNLAERDAFSREARFNHDVVGVVSVPDNAIRFVTPKFQQEKRHAVDVEVCVSLDGGRTFSAACPQLLRVRNRPYVARVSPQCGPCLEGTTVTIVGESLHAQDFGVPVLVRFKGQVIDRRVEAMSVCEADQSGEEEEDGGRRAWMEVTCVVPSIKELEKAGVTPLQVSLSMDGGDTWALWERGLFRVYPPVVLSQVKPKSVVMGGGTPLFVYGSGLFQTASLAMQLCPAGDQGVSVAGSAAAFAKFHSVKQAAVANSPKLGFTGPAMVRVTLNGQQWYTAPDIIAVRSKAVEPMTREQMVEREREREKERLQRIRARAEQMGASSRLPAGMAVREAIVNSVARMKGVGVTLGRNSHGEHCIKEIRRGSEAVSAGLRAGDVVAAVREVRGGGDAEQDDMVYLGRDVESINAAVLLRGPPGTTLGLILADGREIHLKREYGDREGEQPDGDEKSPRDSAIRAKGRKKVVRREGGGGDGKEGAEDQYDPISRASLLRARKHYEKLQVPNAKKGRLRELSLAGIGDVRQWAVVCALLTRQSSITGADLDRFGVERPVIAQIVPKKPLDVAEHPQAQRRRKGDSQANASDANGATATSPHRRETARSGRGDEGERGGGEATERGRRTQLQLELPNGARYEGESVAGVAEGRGEMRFANGDVYRGDFVGGAMHGDGEWVYVNGDVYKGRFQNGVAEGDGRFEGAAGDVYEGSYASNRPHGWGVKLWQNGCRYEGEWKRGKEHGTGLWSINGDRYEGSFRNGVPHGQGRFVKADGDMYQGEWRAGKQHGLGAYFGKGGEVYDGEWTKGRISRAGLHRRREGKRGQEQVLGTYAERWEEEEEGEAHAEVLQRIRERELRDDIEGFLRAVGKVFRERVLEYVRAGVDVNSALPLALFRDTPWWRPPLQGLPDLNTDHQTAPEPPREAEADVTAVEVLCMVWVALETAKGDRPQAPTSSEGGASETEPGQPQSLEESVSGLRGVSRAMLADLLKELLAGGADPTPAMVTAACNGEVEAVRLLVEVCGVRPCEVSLSVRTLADMAQATLQTLFLEGLRAHEDRARQLVVYLGGWEEGGDEETGDVVQTPRGGGEQGWAGLPGAGNGVEGGEWATEADDDRVRRLLEEVEGELPPELMPAIGRQVTMAQGDDGSGGAGQAVYMAGGDTEEESRAKAGLSTLTAEREDLMLRAEQSVRSSVELGVGHDLFNAVVVVVDEIQLEGAVDDAMRKLSHGRGRVSSVYLGMEPCDGVFGDGQEERWWSHDLPPASVLMFHHEMVIDVHPDTAPAARRAFVHALGPAGDGRLLARIMLCGGLDAGPGTDMMGDGSSESGREELDAIELAGCEVDVGRHGRMSEGVVQQLPLRDGDGVRAGMASVRVVASKAIAAIRGALDRERDGSSTRGDAVVDHEVSVARPAPTPFANGDRWLPGVGVADSILEEVAAWRGRDGDGEGDGMAGRFESWEVRRREKARPKDETARQLRGVTPPDGDVSGRRAKERGQAASASRNGNSTLSGNQELKEMSVAWGGPAVNGNGNGPRAGKGRERSERGRRHETTRGKEQDGMEIEDVFDDLYLTGGFLR